MYQHFFKPACDLIITIILLPILAIIILFVGIIIYLEDRGKIFYVAPRLGYKGEVFKMIKFRTMKINSPDIRNIDGSTFNSENDFRLTKVGIWLRKTSLDELPQLLNVLCQKMSIVGPRPDLPEHISLYSQEEMKKLSVLPGITGLNQAYYRNSIPWKDRLQNDVIYVENFNFKLDLKIIFKTLSSVLVSKNVYIS